MSSALIVEGQHEQALRALLDSFNLFVKLQATLELDGTVGRLRSMRQEMGAEKFDALWKEITGQGIPDWLAEAGQTSEVSETSEVSVEQFIQQVITAARQKKPEEAEQFFNAASKMAADPNAPPEVRVLGKVLRAILAGEKSPDLSALPPELAALVRKALKE